MIVLRFRSVGWVVAVAAAALGCYLVTQRVAGERRQLASTERDVLHGIRDVRELEVEIETRGRLSQLERWNSEVLALSAPSPRQYLHGELQLAALDQPAPLPVDPAVAPAPASARSVAYTPAAPAVGLAPVPRPAVRSQAPAPAPVSASLRRVAAAPLPAAEPAPMLRHATYVKPKTDRMAPSPPPIASAGFAADLDAMAAREARKSRR